MFAVHVSILVSAGKLRALGKPRPNAVKFFGAVELLADREWLDVATKTVCQFWWRKNAQLLGLILEHQANDTAMNVRRPGLIP